MTHAMIEMANGNRVEAEFSSALLADIMQAGGMDYALVNGTKEIPEVIEAAQDFQVQNLQHFAGALVIDQA